MALKKYKSANDVLVGVLGYGGAFNMGKRHMQEMQKAGMRPFAVCEIDPARLAVAEQDFPGVETYGDLATMLRKSDVDLIVHITPHKLHFPLALQCLKAGKHVVTEKPFVLTTAECDKLIAEGQKRGLLISTYHNRHWDGCILHAVQRIVKKKVIGDVFRVEAHMGGYGMPRDWWRTSKTISGGILYDWGVHLLEYCLQIMAGHKIVEVMGFSKTGHWASKMPKTHPWKKDCNEDDATAVVRFDSGAMLMLNISNLRGTTRPGWIEFSGTNGAYILDGGSWTIRRPSDNKDEKGRMIWDEQTGQNPEGKSHLFYKNVADALTGKADLIITPQWARRPIHILDLAGQSAAAGRAMKAKYG